MTKNRFRILKTFGLAVLMLETGFQTQAHDVPGDTVVWTSPSTTVKRVHREGCPRLTKDPEELAKLKKWTLAEAEAAGYSLCSRCPGSDTPGKGNDPNNPKPWVNPPPTKKGAEWKPVKTEYKTPACAPLVYMGEDGKLVYKAYSDKGDRIIDFSSCGYKRSEVPIPDIKVVETLTAPASDAKPDGKMFYPVGTDSFEAIQAALDRVGAMRPGEDGFRGAVLLKKGIWYLNNGLIVPAGVVLRGEGDGENGTVLIFTMPDGQSTGITVGRGGTKQTKMPLTGTLGKIASEEGEASYALTLDDGTVCNINIPRFKHDYKMDDFVGSKVTVTLALLTTIQGEKKSYSLKHNMPYTIEKYKDGDEVHWRLPGLRFPNEPQDEEKITESRIADEYVSSGARRITLEDASAFKAGDLVNVIKTTNDKWIEVLGVGERLRHIRGGKDGAGKKPWAPTNFSHIRRIEAVEGNTITLDIMMPQSIVAEHGGGIVRKMEDNSDALCGIESLCVVSNYDKTQKSRSKEANYGNLKNGIGVSCVDGWVRDCTVRHHWFAAVAMEDARDCTVRDVNSLELIGAVRGGKRYPFNISGCVGMLVYKCSSKDGRHDFVVGARTEGPNAFLRCSVPEGGNGEPHHRWGVGTLWDNVSMPKGGSLCSFNRGDSGSGHGWAGANSLFWNCNAPNIVVFDPETIGENNFAIGYTGSLVEGDAAGAQDNQESDGEEDESGAAGLWYANTRAGYWGTAQEGKYYGFAIMGSGHIESPDKAVKPDSLFEQQLIDRIGKERAEKVLN